MKWDRINRKWLLPFENSDYSPFDLFFVTAPFASLFQSFQSFQSLCIIVICGYKLNFTGLIMAKNWEPPYQDRQPVIGLGYLEKNYGKDATEITEISLQGLLRTFFRLTSETSDNTLC